MFEVLRTLITWQVPFAHFDMPIEQMEENLDLILETLQENKPNRKAGSKKASFLASSWMSSNSISVIVRHIVKLLLLTHFQVNSMSWIRLQGWITRVILKMVDGPHYAEFPLNHPLIHDPRLRDFEARQAKEGNITSWVAIGVVKIDRFHSRKVFESPATLF